MSDFDTVLERLLTDPGFTAALAADPDRALSGYQLSADERQLLRSQVSTGAGGDRAVEQRTSKAGMFGLLAPLAGAGAGAGGWHSGFTSAEDPTGAGGHPGFAPAGGGTADGGGPGGTARFDAVSGDYAGFDRADERPPEFPGQSPSELSEFTDQAPPGLPEFVDQGPSDLSGFSGQSPDALSEFATPAGTDPAYQAGVGAQTGFAGVQPEESYRPPDDNYRTRVDVDGDGRWDEHGYRFNQDGSVDVVADMDHDGRSDFVGHDFDRDGRIDEADYDHNSDGRFETHWVDNDGDGWMDDKTVLPE